MPAELGYLEVIMRRRQSRFALVRRSLVQVNRTRVSHSRLSIEQFTIIIDYVELLNREFGDLAQVHEGNDGGRKRRNGRSDNHLEVLTRPESDPMDW